MSSGSEWLRALRFCRRWLTDAVLLYVLTSLTLGGTRLAWPVFYGLVAGWFIVLWLLSRLPPVRSRLAWGLEVAAVNLALTLVLAETALRACSAWTGGSPFILGAMEAYRLVPGRDYGMGLRGNRLGYPGPEFTPTRAPDTWRIAALGDSFAVGPTVSFAANYLTLLEQGLPRTEVYNFGVSGTGPREYQAILQRDVWTFAPDLVLVSVFVGNDVTESMATPRHMDPRGHALCLVLTRAWRLLREHWRHDATESSISNARNLGPGLSSATFREVEARRLVICQKHAPATLEKKWRQALRHLDRIMNDCQKRGVPVAFVLIPDEFQVNPSVLADALREANVDREEIDLSLPQRRLMTFCAGHDVPCLDLLPAFQGLEDVYTPHDTHWNERGNRLAAERLTRWLRERFTPLFGGWPPPPTP